MSAKNWNNYYNIVYMFRTSYLPTFYLKARALSLVANLSLLFLLIALLGFGLESADGQAYNIIFDPVKSPPAKIPTDPKNLFYSVPINQLTSKPIVAYVQNKTGTIMTSLDDTIQVHFISMDKTQRTPTSQDSWRDSGGRLCQRSNPNEDWPLRLNRKLYSTVCGKNTSQTTLTAKIFKGKIIMDWLMHVHPTGAVPPRERFIRVNIPALKVHKDTHLFKITKAAARLVITKQPPQNIDANNPFDITAEIRDKKGVPLTEGLDSVAYVDLTVTYELKTFHNKLEKSFLLRSSDVRLGGSSVTMYQATRDLVIRSRAIAGKVSFNDVRILDPIYDLRLNLTMIMSRDPFLRIPNCRKCYSDVNRAMDRIYDAIFFLPLSASILKDVPSMAFTKRFNVLPQSFAKLKYHSEFKSKNKLMITRNFPIPGHIRIEIIDKNGNRIHSGPDSYLPLVAKTIPPDVCLSSDFSVITTEGIARVSGSICDIRKSVFLVFQSASDPSIKVTSHEFLVGGHVHIAHFDDFTFTGEGRKISPHMNSFVRFAATDINAGLLPGVLKPFNMKLKIDTIETKNDISNTILQYKYIQQRSKKSPGMAIRNAIISGNSLISAALMRELFNHNVTQISLDEKDEKFSYFPLFNRVCWDDKQIYYSFLKYCVDRHWNKMVILRTENIPLSRSMLRVARYLNIGFIHVKILIKDIQWKSRHPDVGNTIRDSMDSVKKANTKIIVCFANETQMPAILHIAWLKKLTSIHGYQWIFVSEHAWTFPFNNPYACDVSQCTTVFRGSLLFTEAYNTSFMNSPKWERVLNYYYSVDKSLYIGKATPYPNIDTSSRMALGYDATWLYAKALTNIASKSLTATTERITEELRKVEFRGLSGFLKLNQYGDREGFMANIQIINATKANEPMEKVAALYKHILLIDKRNNLELLYGDETNVDNTDLSILLPNSSLYNKVIISSKSGRLSKTSNQLFKYANETWPPRAMHRIERTVPPFSCSESCGKHMSDENVNVYDRAICISMNNCQCKPGYFGLDCSEKACPCSHGWCKIPNVCICFEGYTSDFCTIPLCQGGCTHGVCIEPDTCRCDSRIWVGTNCHTHLAAVLIPLIILLILFAYIFHGLYNFIRKRLERANALSNVYWLVDWDEVLLIDKGTNNLKSRKSDVQGTTGNISYMWKKRKWYVKNIHSHTVEQDDVKMHLEMVELVRLNQQNLINYAGACLTYPNVCFLLELTPKGSLEDVLMSDFIQLNWDFRISFIKDICRGMNYLHNKTKIGSHGRLKSSNCLLDNRWCIRITDFGAPSIRYGPYRIEMTEEEKADKYYLMQEALMWTAPELLGRAMCLDDIQMGTKEGDVYSFGIVATEIASRDIPFAYERSELTTCGIIDLIVDKDDPAVENELEIWESLDTGYDIVRPYLPFNEIFDHKSTGKKFLKMLDCVWANDPALRTPFQKLIAKVNHLFPTKKELMDNLMNLLESYSKNLEEIVDERTREVEKERIRLDNILSQMLPKKVIDILKAGEKVEPENFECVTVYFSDIVSFTTIARGCKPMEVVDLLNRLYSLFDNILAQYDVYKVETIGDAYVVSSGVPNLNGNLHAGEIATATLNVISALMNMNVSDITASKLEVRIGIHTGPVVAGVVGLKMPRYTLFGDTMQIAASMESSSKAMHIQMSETTVDILLDLGGYTMKYYKTVLICGKSLDTFWLIGKKDYAHPLPKWDT